MKRVSKIAIAVGTALTLSLAAAVVSAQAGGQGCAGPMGGHEMMSGMMGSGPGWGERMRGHGPRNADQALAAMKTKLGITAAQETAWQTFASHAKQQQEKRQMAMVKMHEGRSAGSVVPSAPELMTQRTELMKQHLAEMETNTAALKDLYAVLTPEQKSIADKRFSAMGRGRNHANQRPPKDAH